MVVGDFLELVALRNQAARKLGFSDYFAMRLYLGEQSEEQLFKLFDELAQFDPRALPPGQDGVRRRTGRQLRHHRGRASAVALSQPDFPGGARGRGYAAGLGLQAAGHRGHLPFVLRRHRLAGERRAAAKRPVQKPGKCPHAFCQDIDRRGNIRLLQNIVPNEEWLATMLHEAGHAVYSKYVGPTLPYALHTDTGPFCTEGVAMMFERSATTSLAAGDGREDT